MLCLYAEQGGAALSRPICIRQPLHSDLYKGPIILTYFCQSSSQATTASSHISPDSPPNHVAITPASATDVEKISLEEGGCLRVRKFGIDICPIT
jgi:hypothetical protein